LVTTRKIQSNNALVPPLFASNFRRLSALRILPQDEGMTRLGQKCNKTKQSGNGEPQSREPSAVRGDSAFGSES
jgi:hypothetical protein